MLDNILSTIICYTFDDLIGRMQWKKHLEGETMHGMEITFKLHEVDYTKDESLYPSVQLLIFAESNYVGVFYRESETRDEYGEWLHLSCHDSCWKGDGVDLFISMFAECDGETGRGGIAVLGWHGGICNNKWYLKQEITEQKVIELREATKKARGR